MLEQLTQFKGHIAAALPFMLMTQDAHAGRFNMQRILEAILIAAATAGITMWGTQQVIETKLDNLTQKVEQNRAQIEKTNDNLGLHIRDEFQRMLNNGSKK